MHSLRSPNTMAAETEQGAAQTETQLGWLAMQMTDGLGPKRIFAAVQALGALGQGTGTLDNAGALDAALADSTTWFGFPRRRP